MSSESEFSCWLRRPEKTFLENFRFALRAWQSAEFTLSNKYELILSWISEQAVNLSQVSKFHNELRELLQLRAQPGLIDQDIKRNFIETILTLTELKAQEDQANTCIFPRLLQYLIEFELLQDIYRTDYELHTRVLGRLLDSYDLHLRHFSDTNRTEAKSFNVTSETEFFSGIINTLKNNVKHTGDAELYDKSFCKHTIVPLTKVLLMLRSNGLCFFDGFLQLERLLTEHYTDLKLVKRISTMPMHVRLLTFECAIINRRGVEEFLRILLQWIFVKLPTKPQQEDTEIPYALTAIAYILEMLRKHDINLNFSINTENSEPILTYLGSHLLPYVQEFKEQHLREVLLLLCAALRLNPLILEQDIFQVTTWLIVAGKNSSEEQELYAEYLTLLMDMFRKLSRAEKFVFNILKTLKQWLDKFEYTTSCKGNAKLKRKSNIADEAPAKKRNLTTIKTFTKIDFYLHIIFLEFHKANECMKSSYLSKAIIESFPYLRNAWPSKSVGITFSKLITGLVSKPSLVIWKSLLYSLKELLEKLEQNSENVYQENSLFLLDLHAALLCQYFNGCRLAEQWDKFSAEINDNCNLTTKVFAQFGHFLQSQEYHRRSTDAFLECSYHFTNFKLLISYYLPDGYENTSIKSVEHLHNFLTAEEWAILQQRVLNFGKSYCKFLFDRLMLQRVHAQAILATKFATNIPKTLQSFTKNIAQEEMNLLLQHIPNPSWLLVNLCNNTKTQMLKSFLDKDELIIRCAHDQESLDILITIIYTHLCDLLAISKTSMLSALECDFAKMRQYMIADSNTADKQLQKLAEVIEKHAQTEYKIKQLPKEEDIQRILHLLGHLPIAHVRRQSKYYIFTLHLAFYSDLKAAALETNALENAAFEILNNLLHFGHHVPVFKYFNASTILRILPVDGCWPFYELLFATIKNEEKGTEQFLTALIEIIEETQRDDGKLSNDYRRLVLIAIETLAVLTGPSAKRIRKYFERLLEIYSKYVTSHFKKLSPGGDGSSHKKFVEKTIAGFATYANAILCKATVSSKNINDPTIQVDADFRRLCKIYIGHSMYYRNPHALRLMQVALTHRSLLHLGQDEIEFVLNHYWQQLNADLKSQGNVAYLVKTTESTVKMIIGYKTNEDFLLTLQSLDAQGGNENEVRYILCCLELIAKCSLSNVKGAIFNAKFKDIIHNIMTYLTKDDQQQFVDKPLLLSILATEKSVIENKMIPMSMDTLDDTLVFLMDINIKKLPISDSNLGYFKQLHMSMCEILGSLVKHRHVLLMDRVPQFIHIFKDLLQSIVWYKSERQKDLALSTTELEDLTELSLKMEVLMHLVAAHSVHIKRVSPFVLAFVINLIVGNKRATTLYPKIKTHVENICYELIGICDHRVGRFILRCSNEAARQVYEILVRDHTKYHKFKGKV